MISSFLGSPTQPPELVFQQGVDWLTLSWGGRLWALSGLLPDSEPSLIPQFIHLWNEEKRATVKNENYQASTLKPHFGCVHGGTVGHSPISLAEWGLSALARTWCNGFSVQCHRHGSCSWICPTQPWEEGGSYPVGANAQVNAHVGPDEVGVDLGLPCPHHLVWPHHVLLEGPVLLQDRELGRGTRQGKHWMFLWGKSRQKTKWEEVRQTMHRESGCHPHGKKDGIAPCPRDPAEGPL